MAHHTDIALLRLVAQRVAGPGEPDVASAARWLTATQGQHHGGAVTSLALRTAGGTRAAVNAAFDAGLVVKSWPMRGTLHMLAAEDLRWMLDLLAGRVLAQMGRRRKELGLDEATLAKARSRAEAALQGTSGLPRKDLLAVWEDAGLEPAGGRGYHMLTNLSLHGVVCFGPSAGNEQRVVLVDEWIPAQEPLDRADALARLAERYFRGHGPATEADFARWAGLTLTDARKGIAAVAERLESVTVEGSTAPYLMASGTAERLAQHRDAAAGVHLLPGFDEYILGYADRTAVLPAEFAPRIVPGGNGVFRPTVVAGGQVVGTWQFPTTQKRTLAAEPFTAFPPEVSQRLPAVFDALPT